MEWEVAARDDIVIIAAIVFPILMGAAPDAKWNCGDGYPANVSREVKETQQTNPSYSGASVHKQTSKASPAVDTRAI